MDVFSPFLLPMIYVKKLRLDPSDRRKKTSVNDNPFDDAPLNLAAECPADIDVAIAGLARSQARFSQYIDRHWADLNVRQLAPALSVHALNAVRIAQLLRDRRALGVSGPFPVQVDLLVTDLDGKLTLLSDYIDTHWPDLGSWQWRTLVEVYSHNLGRLARLMRHRRALRDAPFDELERAINAALLLPGQEWEDAL